MADIITYLKWRGDLNFKERAFCEVDNLVLSMFAYVDLPDITKDLKNVNIARIAKVYFSEKSCEESELQGYEKVFYYMAQSQRFCEAKIKHYENIVNESTQFAAVCVELDDGTEYILYRGTDTSIIGWREDFAISFQITLAQERAVSFLEKCMEKEEIIYRVGGHSKGGNLAVYAAMKCCKEKKKNILEIYNNDGPGICDELMDYQGFLEIKDRIKRFIPEFSIIGKLFESDILPCNVGSSARGIVQHDAMTWEIEGDRFCKRTDISKECKIYNQIFATWIESATMEQRESFTRDFFDALEAGGARDIREIPEGGFDGFGTILVSIAESESRTKIVIGKLFQSALDYLKKIDIKKTLKSRDGIIGITWLLIGLFFMVFPHLAVQTLGISLVLTGFVWSGKKLMDCALGESENRQKKRRKLLVYMFGMCFTIFLLSNYKMITISANVAIGIILLIYSLSKFKLVMKGHDRRIVLFLWIFIGLLTFMLGIVSVVTPVTIFSQKMLTVGSFFVIYGMGKVLNDMYKREHKKS